MRLIELFLKETSMEDRAIISLAQAIYDYIDKKYNFGAAQEPSELTEKSPFDFDHDDDFSYDDDINFGNIEEPEQLEHQVGTIGNLFNTPLEILNNVMIVLTTPEGMKKRHTELGSNSSGEGSDNIGMWLAHTDEMILNMDYLGTRTLKSTIAHELRHALDDYKSDWATSHPEKSYNQPRKKSVDSAPDDEKGDVEYLSQPAEINARFVQVLHDMVPVIKRATKLDADVAKKLLDRSFEHYLEKHHISRLFPERTQSKQFKRLLKRGLEFIHREFDYAKSEFNK